MKVRIIKDIEGLKAGDEITLNGHPPVSWAGHYEMATRKIVETHPLDRDGDGRKGGSLPKSKREVAPDDKNDG